MSGQGRAVVCCVGERTLLAQTRKPGDLKIEEQNTDLEKKLERTANQISKYAVAATVISVVSHLIFLFLMILFSDKVMFSNSTLLEILNICIIAVVLMMVAIPEGLPLAVSIAMALSISRLKDDEILIKNVESIQSCAMLHDLCVSKTGTITKGKLKVARFQIGGQQTVHNDFENIPNFFEEKLEISPENKALIKECILSNSDVRIEINECDSQVHDKKPKSLL